MTTLNRLHQLQNSSIYTRLRIHLISQHGEGTVDLKGDSVSGLAGDYIASGTVLRKPHPYETRTSFEGAHYQHAILMCWSDCSRCCWVKAICVFRHNLKRREMYAGVQKVLTQLLPAKNGTPSGSLHGLYEFHEAVMLGWESLFHTYTHMLTGMLLY